MMGEGEGKGELRGDDRWRDIVAEGRCGWQATRCARHAREKPRRAP